MARADSTSDVEDGKLPEFWLHKASGNLALKRKGRLYYLGKTDDEARAFYLQHQDRIERGQAILDLDPNQLTVGDIVNHFLIAHEKRVKSDDLSSRTYLDYARTGKRVIKELGRNTPVDDLTPRDFQKYKEKVAENRNPIGVGNEVTRVKTIFKWAYDYDYLDRPAKFGPQFRKAKKKVVRRHRRKKGKTLFGADDVNALLDESGVHVRAMIYLGINCGFKNSDIAQLPLKEIKLDSPWIDWDRPKTEEYRRCPLWPETVAALSMSLKRRPKPKAKRAKDKFFVNRDGDVWLTNNPNDSDHLAVAFRHILRRLEIWRSGMGFSWLRHTFRTWADEARDQPAANLIMGHSDPTMAAVYRQEIGDARLIAVSNTVKAFLNGERTL